MASLMSIFDPSMSAFPSLGWMVTLIGISTLKMVFWKVSSPSLAAFSYMIKKLLSLFKLQSVIFVGLFLFILNMNLLGLLPLVFSPTSHLSFNLSISLMLWFGMMIWYIQSNPVQLLVHLTPVGSPVVLAPFLVLIELVSNLIRPITLSLRLMANIMAGHMILTLISKGVFTLNIMMGSSLFWILISFMMFEFGVAMIQSYVFSSLMALYWEESEESH